MREALDRVRAELGRDAVILSTRQVPVRRLLPWGQKEEVEITAGLGIATKPIATRAARPARQPVPPVAPMPRLTEQERRAAEIVKELQRRDFGGTIATAASNNRLDLLTPEEPHVTLQPTTRGVRAVPLLEAGPSADLSKRLDAIERMLADLGRRHRASAEVPADLLGVYDGLIAAETDDAIARDLVGRLKDQATPAQLADPTVARAVLTRLVEAELQCAGPIAVTPGSRKVVALVGPTGVGKTTTLAKLAANFGLRDGLRTGLVTVDTYRIAAVEQLKTYAEIIDLPMKVVAAPAEMRSALDELTGLDLVLIDTAGRSPRDAEQIAELADLLDAARPDETHLVLSLTAGRRTLAQAVERFKAVAPSAVIVTKLDEADGAGPVLGLCRDGRLPVSYVTTGQDVPDDIEPARPDRLARRIVSVTRVQSRESREERAIA